MNVNVWLADSIMLKGANRLENFVPGWHNEQQDGAGLAAKSID
jgi:hypothetical protein